jgi:flagellar hook protein FlgE
MSLVGAFIAGVTGIDAQSNKMGAISDNISNANTVGYKPTNVLFKTLVTGTNAPTQLGGTGPIPFNFAPGGVIPTPEKRMDLQGVLTASSSSTDLGITGRGFFAVTNAVNTTSGAVAKGADFLVTRAGSFSLDQNGFLVNSAGFFLLGTPTSSPTGSGVPSALTGLQPVKLQAGPNVTIGGVATSNVSISANLPATAAVGDTRALNTTVFDSNGNAYTLGITFTNTGTNAWSAAATSLTAVNSSSGVTATVSSSPVSLTFSGDGTLSSGTGSQSLGTFSLSNGASLSPSFNFGSGFAGLTQFGSAFSSGNVQQDGRSSGTRTGVTVDSNGIVDEVYTNGAIIPRFQVPVVTYINPDGLDAQSGNVWAGTATSGTAQISASNTNGAGQITPSTLEQSSVDLSSEFTDMIISQATYSANTKTITTADQMYQTIAQLR